MFDFLLVGLFQGSYLIIVQLQIHNCIINLLLFIFSSPLGELFDHGLDSSAAFLIPISLFSLFGHGPHSVTLWELYQLMLACLLGFYLAHWEKYNTGTLFLPWTYDASQIVSFFTVLWDLSQSQLGVSYEEIISMPHPTQQVVGDRKWEGEMHS